MGVLCGVGSSPLKSLEKGKLEVEEGEEKAGRVEMLVCCICEGRREILLAVHREMTSA